MAQSNQYTQNRRATILAALSEVREWLRLARQRGQFFGENCASQYRAVDCARAMLEHARYHMSDAPASTRRRWRCGQ